MLNVRSLSGTTPVLNASFMRAVIDGSSQIVSSECNEGDKCSIASLEAETIPMAGHCSARLIQFPQDLHCISTRLRHGLSRFIPRA
jgi:hypothetical protein